ncbi:MAG: RNA methyltransferase [Acidobacteriota bacterium]|nr:RNA methyltransferase [Acidobacteriota bacterium]
MSDTIITSRQNSLIQHARAVREGKEKNLIFVEGLRLGEEAARAGLDVEVALYTAAFAAQERGANLLRLLRPAAKRLQLINEDVLAAISDTKTPQGVIIIAQRPDTSAAVLSRSQNDVPLVVIMHGVNNPANAGAMLRVAEAAGASGIISTAGSTDLFSPKSLRGAMGSSFRLPVWDGADLPAALHWCAARGIRTISTSLQASQSHTEVDWTEPCAVLVGAEAAGLSADEIATTDLSICIPMRPPVESLNVAAALAVILYEAERQRRGSRGRRQEAESGKQEAGAGGSKNFPD